MPLNVTCLLPKPISLLLEHEEGKKSVQILLSRANRVEHFAKNQTDLLFSLFEIPRAFHSLAAFIGLADGFDTSNDFWLKADPLVLKADWTTFYADSTSCLIDLEKFNSVITALKDLFHSYHIKLHTPHGKGWYLSMPFDQKLETTSPEDLSQPILETQWLHDYNRMNSAMRMIPWKRLLTEVQMILHEMKAPFNTLWVWGGGRLPPQGEHAFVHTLQVGADLPLVQGLTHWTQSHYRSLNERDYELDNKNQNHLLVLQNVSLEKSIQVLKALIRGLRSFEIQTVALYDGRGVCYHLNPYTIRRFWRQKISISE